MLASYHFDIQGHILNSPQLSTPAPRSQPVTTNAAASSAVQQESPLPVESSAATPKSKAGKDEKGRGRGRGRGRGGKQVGKTEGEGKDAKGAEDKAESTRKSGY